MEEESGKSSKGITLEEMERTLSRSSKTSMKQVMEQFLNEEMHRSGAMEDDGGPELKKPEVSMFKEKKKRTRRPSKRKEEAHTAMEIYESTEVLDNQEAIIDI